MPTIISRAQASLPPVPSSVGTRSLASWVGIKVHHTGGGFSSWRAIYDWQVKNRPPGERLVDIGYSFGIANGRVTELRGWTRSPAHDHQNSTIGVVLGGNYQSALPPAEDLDALVWFCQEARRKTGKRLPITGHRDTWPRGDSRYSTCPGDRLYAYLPTLRARVDHDDEEDDMPTADEVADKVLERIVAHRWPRADGNGEAGFEKSTDWARQHAGDVKADVSKKVLPKLDALIAANEGLDTEAVLARIDQRAAEDAARDTALLALLEEHADGSLDAEQVVRRLGELLTAAGDES